MIDSLNVITTAALDISVLSDDHAFETLANEWDELLEHSDQQNFFLRWGWNELWWRTYRPPNSRLFIVTCRDSLGRLTGLAPLYWRQRRTAGITHLRELHFLGTGVYAKTSEYLDVVARRGYERSVVEAVVGLLRRDTRWDHLCLTEIPASSTILPLVRQTLGEEAQIKGCNRSYYIDTSIDWDTFTSGLTRVARENIFRRSRRVARTYETEFRLIDSAEELDPAIDALIRLHQARWSSKGEPGAFALNGTERLFREAARIAFFEGRLRLWTLTLDKQVAAVLLGFVDNGVLHAFQTGFDPAYSQVGLGGVMIAKCIRACVADPEIRAYDLMGGTDKYKERWTTTTWDSVSLSFLRPGLHSRTFKTLEQATFLAKWIARKTVSKRLRVAAHKFIIKRRHYSDK